MDDEGVPADCPACEDQTDHEVIRDADSGATVRCAECGLVHRLEPRRERVHDLALVLSDGARSWSDRLLVDPTDEVRVGDEFEHLESRYLVTGLERADGLAAERAPAQDVRVLHAKRFDHVNLKLSLNEGPATQSFEVQVDPEEPVRIGQVLEAQGRRMVVKTLKSDQNRTLHKGFLLSRNVRRAFCDPAPPGAEPGSMMAVRPRGRPEKPVPGRSGPRGGPRSGSGGPRGAGGARSGGSRSGAPRSGDARPRSGDRGPRSGDDRPRDGPRSPPPSSGPVRPPGAGRPDRKGDRRRS